jgi:hypothetical protein
MLPSNQFAGLPMPVFTAFGWAGEETATNFALSQLELFIQALHSALPRELQTLFPHYGLDRQAQSVYLAASDPADSGLFIAFHARPSSLEIMLSLTNKKALAKGLKTAEGDATNWHRQLKLLGDEWNLRLQQMEYDEENDTAVHYQDIFKDSIANLDIETAVATIAKANFLNSEPQWVTPTYISCRFDAEKIAAMGTAVIKVINEQLREMLPLIRLLAGQSLRTPGKAKAKAKAVAGEKKDVAPIIPPPPIEAIDEFTYLAELKPLHLRRGFINLTPDHWPFFAISARTETRPVTIYYDGRYDNKSAVWRLVPDDQARIVLSPAVREWLEDHFDAEDKIQVTAHKLDEKDIQISLQIVG